VRRVVHRGAIAEREERPSLTPQPTHRRSRTRNFADDYDDELIRLKPTIHEIGSGPLADALVIQMLALEELLGRYRQESDRDRRRSLVSFPF
jgi:hypothetical protein